MFNPFTKENLNDLTPDFMQANGINFKIFQQSVLPIVTEGISIEGFKIKLLFSSDYFLDRIHNLPIATEITDNLLRNTRIKVSDIRKEELRRIISIFIFCKMVKDLNKTFLQPITKLQFYRGKRFFSIPLIKYIEKKILKSSLTDKKMTPSERSFIRDFDYLFNSLVSEFDINDDSKQGRPSDSNVTDFLVSLKTFFKSESNHYMPKIEQTINFLHEYYFEQFSTIPCENESILKRIKSANKKQHVTKEK